MHILLYDQRNVSNICDLACASGKFVQKWSIKVWVECNESTHKLSTVMIKKLCIKGFQLASFN
jgi:hypothetical protein